MARPCICRSTPRSRAAAASRRSCNAATAIWCGFRLSAGIIDEVPCGRLYKDGSLLVEADARTVADRKRLSFAGCGFGRACDHRQGRAGRTIPYLDLIGIPERDRDGGLMHEAVL